MMLDNGHTLITFLEYELGLGWRWCKVPYNFYLLQCHDVVISALVLIPESGQIDKNISVVENFIILSLLEQETFRIMMSC